MKVLIKIERDLFGKVIEILEGCFESWQAIPSQFMRKLNENLKNMIENELKSQQDRGEVGIMLEAKFN